MSKTKTKSTTKNNYSVGDKKGISSDYTTILIKKKEVSSQLKKNEIEIMTENKPKCKNITKIDTNQNEDGENELLNTSYLSVNSINTPISSPISNISNSSLSQTKSQITPTIKVTTPTSSSPSISNNIKKVNKLKNNAAGSTNVNTNQIKTNKNNNKSPTKTNPTTHIEKPKFSMNSYTLATAGKSSSAKLSSSNHSLSISSSNLIPRSFSSLNLNENKSKMDTTKTPTTNTPMTTPSNNTNTSRKMSNLSNKKGHSPSCTSSTLTSPNKKNLLKIKTNLSSNKYSKTTPLNMKWNCSSATLPNLNSMSSNSNSTPASASTSPTSSSYYLSKHIYENFNPEMILFSSSKYPFNPEFSRKYRVKAEMGRGGFGFVYVAERISDGKEVAVKFIIKNKVPITAWVKDPDLGIIPRECYLLKQINHPCIIKFLDCYSDRRFFYLVTELHGSPWTTNSLKKLREYYASTQQEKPWYLMNGSNNNLNSSSSITTLHEESEEERENNKKMYDSNFDKEKKNILPSSTTISNKNKKNLTTLPPPSSKHTINNNNDIEDTPPRRPSMDLFECIEAKYGCFTEDQTKYIFIQILSAIQYLKSKNIIHRDLKDENIVIDKDLNIKLIDFGAAIQIKGGRVFDRFVGTIPYIAPEILSGQEYGSIEQDVYSLGVLLYLLIYGKLPESVVDTNRNYNHDYASVNFSTSITSNFSDFTINGKYCSEEVKDLMKWMLQRLPSARPTLEEIFNHPWIKSSL